MTREVHPAAAVFPMLPADELQALADDIAAHGLQQPLVLTPDGFLLDGRNRLAACQLAGVVPTCVTYDGDDPVGYVISANVKRRQLTAAHRAFAAARLMPERADGAQRPRGSTAAKGTIPLSGLARAFGVSDKLVKQARALLDDRPDLAARAEAGEAIKPLYDEMVADRRDAAKRQADLERIGRRDSDLAGAVATGTMTVEQALSESSRRERIEVEETEAAEEAAAASRRLVESAMRTLADFDALNAERLDEFVEGFPPADVAGLPFPRAVSFIERVRRATCPTT